MESNTDIAPIYQVILSGGIGGGTADFLMHGLDTLKTRLQGQPYPPKYTNLYSTFTTILKEEGVMALYGGIQPAMIGSVLGTMVYFGAYENLKRTFREHKVSGTFANLTSAGIAEFLVSLVYVPSEVLKTRMQLQGKYNNPHFISGYNYVSWRAALTSIVKNDGFGTLFRGYQATLLRDVPCTAIQFAIYEWLKVAYLGKGNNSQQELGFKMELLIGGTAGAVAGGITTPLDVVKTVLQTQKEPSKAAPRSLPSKRTSKLSLPSVPRVPNTLSQSLLTLDKLPNNSTKAPFATGIINGLITSYTTYGFKGLFRGLAPRTIWLACQSSIMFVVYEQCIGWFSLRN